MLIILAAGGAGGVTRRSVRQLLWEGVSNANASNSMRQALFRARQLLGANAIVEADGRLTLTTPIRIDLIEADRLIAEGRLTEALTTLAAPVEEALDVAGDALRAWVRDFRTRLERRLLDALTRGWNVASRGPDPGSYGQTLSRARDVFGDLPDILWLQIELAVTLRDAGAFDQTARALTSAASLDPARRSAVTSRLMASRRQLRDRLEDGSGDIGQPIHADALHALERAWQGALSGATSVVSLVGDRGTGRSWLIREMGRRCMAEGGRTIPLVALGSSSTAPSACLRDLTVALKGCRGAAGIRPAYAEHLDRLHEGMLGVGDQTIQAVHDLLAAVTAEGPVLVSLDDADRYDRQILARLVRQLQEEPIPGLLVIVVVQSLDGIAETPEIAIGPTGPGGIRRLLESMARLPRADWVPPLIESLHAWSEGRPGRAAPAILELHRAGHLEVIDDRWTLVSELPVTLEALGRTAA